jgi:hypothetical protein
VCVSSPNHSTRKAHAPYYIVICGLSGTAIFLDFLINGVILFKNVETKEFCCLKHLSFQDEFSHILCFVDPASRYNLVKKNQIDAQLVLSVFRQTRKRIISTNCCIHIVVPPDDEPRYARNMYRLTKFTKNS